MIASYGVPVNNMRPAEQSGSSAVNYALPSKIVLSVDRRHDKACSARPTPLATTAALKLGLYFHTIRPVLTPGAEDSDSPWPMGSL